MSSETSVSVSVSEIPEGESAPPLPKKPKRQCHFDRKWIEEFQRIGRSSKGQSKLTNFELRSFYGLFF